MESQLKCNFQTCRLFLGKTTYLLSCGHAFCEVHGKEIRTTCPLCSSAVASLLANFSPQFISQQKHICLVGFPPTEALESVSTAIKFWDFQKNLTAKQNDLMMVNSEREKFIEYEAHYDELLHHYDEIKEKYEDLKSEFTKLQNKEKEILRPQETPIIFNPPSNQKLKISDNYQNRGSITNLFTPLN